MFFSLLPFSFPEIWGLFCSFVSLRKRLAIKLGCLKISNLPASAFPGLELQVCHHTWLELGVLHLLFTCPILYSPLAIVSWFRCSLYKKPFSVSSMDSLLIATFVFYLLFHIFILWLQCSVLPWETIAALVTPRMVPLVPVNPSEPTFLPG